MAELNEMTAKELIKAGLAEIVGNKVVVEDNAPLIENKISSKPKKAIKR